jgi:hypothetical protein
MTRSTIFIFCRWEFFTLNLGGILPFPSPPLMLQLVDPSIHAQFLTFPPLEPFPSSFPFDHDDIYEIYVNDVN